MTARTSHRRSSGAIRRLPSGRWQVRYTGPDDAARYAARALLAQQGLRPTTSGGHYVVEVVGGIPTGAMRKIPWPCHVDIAIDHRPLRVYGSTSIAVVAPPHELAALHRHEGVPHGSAPRRPIERADGCETVLIHAA